MAGHNQNYDIYTFYGQESANLADPGAGGTIKPEGMWGGRVVLESSGTRFLPDNIPAGIAVYVQATAGGATIQSKAFVTLATMADGDTTLFVSTGPTTWAAVALKQSGAAATVTASSVTYSNPDVEVSTVGQALDFVIDYSLVKPATYATSATATSVTPAAGVLTAAAHVFWENTANGALSLTPRTAALLYADHAATYQQFPAANYEYLLTIVNRGDNTITMQTADGLTYVGETTIATLTTRTYVVKFVSPTAATMTSVNKGTIET